jgi:hypothetical protein
VGQFYPRSRAPSISMQLMKYLATNLYKYDK